MHFLIDLICGPQQTVEVTVPEIEEMRLAHYATIASECTASLAPQIAKLYVVSSCIIIHLIFIVFRSSE